MFAKYRTSVPKEWHRSINPAPVERNRLVLISFAFKLSPDDTENRGQRALAKVVNAVESAGIETYHNCKRGIGSAWKPQWFRQVKNADVAIVMLSAGYFNSKWCIYELVALFESHLGFNSRIIPIFVGDPGESMNQHVLEAFFKTNGMYQGQEHGYAAFVRSVARRDPFNPRKEYPYNEEDIHESVVDCIRRWTGIDCPAPEIHCPAPVTQRANGNETPFLFSFASKLNPDDTTNGGQAALENIVKAVEAAGLTTLYSTKVVSENTEKTVWLQQVANAKIAIVMLSAGYFTSKSCISELVVLLERRLEFKNRILPICVQDPGESTDQHVLEAFFRKEGMYQGEEERAASFVRSVMKLNHLNADGVYPYNEDEIHAEILRTVQQSAPKIGPAEERTQPILFSFATKLNPGDTENRGQAALEDVVNAVEAVELTTFHSNKLGPGDTWRMLWFGQAYKSQIAIVMLSAGYFTSIHCIAELVVLLERNLAGKIRILPVCVEDPGKYMDQHVLEAFLSEIGTFKGEESTTAAFIRSVMNRKVFNPLGAYPYNKQEIHTEVLDCIRVEKRKRIVGPTPTGAASVVDIKE